MALIELQTDIAAHVRLAVFQAEGVTAAGESPALEQDLLAISEKLRAAYPDPGAAVTLFGPARTLYRTLKLDPTKIRPSSEALIRRIITGRGLYRINRIVDACNLCSIDFALPIGLYDTAQVRWPALLRIGRAGEGYRGLGKDHVNVAERYALVDQEGPFGNPSSDSQRTCIRAETTACTFVIFAPAGYARALLARHLDLSAERMTRYNGGATTQKMILP
ncbi:MAG: phenylalanine--tRNA ligase beta subunit-related protein [Candidatus Eisenbacteria bacterium]